MANNDQWVMTWLSFYQVFIFHVILGGSYKTQNLISMLGFAETLLCNQNILFEQKVSFLRTFFIFYWSYCCLNLTFRFNKVCSLSVTNLSHLKSHSQVTGHCTGRNLISKKLKLEEHWAELFVWLYHLHFYIIPKPSVS